MADDRRAVSCVRRRVLLSRNPSVEVKVSPIGTAVQQPSAGDAEDNG